MSSAKFLRVQDCDQWYADDQSQPEHKVAQPLALEELGSHQGKQRELEEGEHRKPWTNYASHANCDKFVEDDGHEKREVPGRGSRKT